MRVKVSNKIDISATFALSTISAASSHLLYVYSTGNVNGKQKGIVANDAPYHSKWFLDKFFC